MTVSASELVTPAPGGALQLTFGYRSVSSVLFEEAEQTRSLGAEPIRHDDTELEILETILPQGHPFMWQPDRY